MTTTVTSREVRTPEPKALAELVQEAQGLTTQHGQPIVIQQVHIHTQRPAETLATAGFFGTMRIVFRPVGQVAKWGTLPWWGPILGLGREVARTPKRVLKAIQAPWRQDFEALKADHAAWRAATEEERSLMEAETRGWGLISIGFLALVLLAPPGTKWLPMTVFLGGSVLRPAWCPVRWWLDAPQGGLQGLQSRAELHWEVFRNTLLDRQAQHSLEPTQDEPPIPSEDTTDHAAA